MHIAVSITLSPTLYAFEAVPDISYLNHHDPSPHTAAHDSGHYSDIVENLIHGRYPEFDTFKCSHLYLLIPAALRTKHWILYGRPPLHVQM
jgi:hypothetical protein